MSESRQLNVKEFLPHREPFLFIDGVNRLEENLIVAWRVIKPEEFYFTGHFPGNPIFPGVLMVEAIAQAGILLALTRRRKKEDGKPDAGKTPLFAGIERVRFRRIVRPGERLDITATIIAEKAGVYKISGRVDVNGELACEAIITGTVR
ncbi:MAG: 3-hydroxyacyl-ACP dehydratase FabZ [candidate division WOR-3 bacterium]